MQETVAQRPINNEVGLLKEQLTTGLAKSFLAELELYGTVVEIGASGGSCAAMLPQSWDHYVTVEANEFIYHQRKRDLARLNENIVTLHGSAVKLPMADRSADTVLCNFSLSDYSVCRQSISQTIAEIRRITKPGARLVVIDRSGGVHDGWCQLLQLAAHARGERLSVSVNDVWIEIFSFLGHEACLERAERLTYLHSFRDMNDALEQSQALIPDLLSNAKVRQVAYDYFHGNLDFQTEGVAVVASLRCD